MLHQSFKLWTILYSFSLKSSCKVGRVITICQLGLLSVTNCPNFSHSFPWIFPAPCVFTRKMRTYLRYYSCDKIQWVPALRDFPDMKKLASPKFKHETYSTNENFPTFTKSGTKHFRIVFHEFFQHRAFSREKWEHTYAIIHATKYRGSPHHSGKMGVNYLAIWQKKYCNLENLGICCARNL